MEAIMDIHNLIMDIHNLIIYMIIDIIIDIHICQSKSSTIHLWISISNYVDPWFNHNWIVDNYNW